VSKKLRIAHMSGPTATIQNSPPLVTSNKARRRHGLPLRARSQDDSFQFDALRPQRLAAPVKVYVEQFSAHPLEHDAADLYGAPDGYIGADGAFSRDRRSDRDKPVYEVELSPEDGLYPLPYMARQADGRPWEEECADPEAPAERARQGFYPDGSRVFEEMDRLGVGPDGLAGLASSLADMTFHRVLPPGGFTKGHAHEERKDEGEGDIAPEQRGKHFFPYKPRHLSAPPPRPALAKVTNDVQAILSSGDYDGAIWTQGSPNIEDSAYWFNLLIDTTLPIACNAAQRPHGQISSDGPQNLLDSLHYIDSRIWADADGRNRLGTLLIQDQQFFAAREAAKADARPGGYIATGGHGGILGQVGHLGRAVVTYVPAYKHTYLSDVRVTRLPSSVEAVRMGAGGLERFEIAIKDGLGKLLEDAIPSVSILKEAGYCTLGWDDDPDQEIDLKAAIDHKLAMGRLGGFVVEGTVPTGNMTSTARQKLVMRAVFSGLPVVRVGRGNHEAFADPHPALIAGSNLTATKARLLLMASLMKLGCLPAAADPAHPSKLEAKRTAEAVGAYQAIFDCH
jgi:L-asparaginase